MLENTTDIGRSHTKKVSGSFGGTEGKGGVRQSFDNFPCPP